MTNDNHSSSDYHRRPKDNRIGHDTTDMTDGDDDEHSVILIGALCACAAVLLTLLVVFLYKKLCSCQDNGLGHSAWDCRSRASHETLWHCQPAQPCRCQGGSNHGLQTHIPHPPPYYIDETRAIFGPRRSQDLPGHPLSASRPLTPASRHRLATHRNGQGYPSVLDVAHVSEDATVVCGSDACVSCLGASASGHLSNIQTPTLSRHDHHRLRHSNADGLSHPSRLGVGERVRQMSMATTAPSIVTSSDRGVDHEVVQATEDQNHQPEIAIISNRVIYNATSTSTIGGISQNISDIGRTEEVNPLFQLENGATATSEISVQTDAHSGHWTLRTSRHPITVPEPRQHSTADTTNPKQSHLLNSVPDLRLSSFSNTDNNNVQTENAADQEILRNVQESESTQGSNTAKMNFCEQDGFKLKRDKTFKRLLNSERRHNNGACEYSSYEHPYNTNNTGASELSESVSCDDNVDIDPIFLNSQDMVMFRAPTDGVRQSLYRPTQGTQSCIVDGKLLVYMAKVLTPAGGDLYLDKMGIRLTVPPGALVRQQLICLVLNWDLSDNPKMSRQEALVAPVVFCGPHGLTFEKPCTLSFKHCAYDSRFTKVMCSNTDLYDSKDWYGVSPVEEQQTRSKTLPYHNRDIDEQITLPKTLHDDEGDDEVYVNDITVPKHLSDDDDDDLLSERDDSSQNEIQNLKTAYAVVSSSGASPRSDSSKKLHFTSDECQVQTSHFSLFTCIQRPPSASHKLKKWLQIAVFTRELRPSCQHHEIRVYFLNRTPCALEWALQNEGAHDFRLACPVMNFLFEEMGESMLVQVSYLSDGWTLVSELEDQREIAFENIWHGTCPHAPLSFRKSRNQSERPSSVDSHAKPAQTPYPGNASDRSAYKHLSETSSQQHRDYSSFGIYTYIEQPTDISAEQTAQKTGEQTAEQSEENAESVGTGNCLRPCYMYAEQPETSVDSDHYGAMEEESRDCISELPEVSTHRRNIQKAQRDNELQSQDGEHGRQSQEINIDLRLYQERSENKSTHINVLLFKTEGHELGISVPKSQTL